MRKHKQLLHLFRLKHFQITQNTQTLILFSLFYRLAKETIISPHLAYPNCGIPAEHHHPHLTS